MKNKPHNLLPDQTLTEKLISKGFWLYLFAFLSMPLGYFIRVIISNDLSVGEVGIIYGLLSLMGLLSLLGTLGIQQGALIHFVQKYFQKNDKNRVTTTYKIVRYTNLIMTFFISILLLVFINIFGENYINHEYAKNILYIFLGVFIFTSLQKPLTGVFNLYQDVFSPKFSDFVKQVIISLLILILFLLGEGNVIYYSIFFLVGIIICYILEYIFYKIKYKKELNNGKIIKDKKLFKGIFFYGLNVFVAMNALMLIKNIDIQMLMFLKGNESVGYYTNYLSLINIALFLFAPILSIFFPIISEMYHKKQNKKIEFFQNFLYKYFLFFSISISFLLIVFGKVLAVIFYGEKFLFSGELLTTLAIFGFLQVIFTINFAILMGTGNQGKRTKVILSALIFNIILNIILIPILGGLGAGLATGISWLLLSIFSFYYVNKNIPINFDYIFLIKNLIIFSIICFIYYIFIPDIFVLQNEYRLNNLFYLVIMGLSSYIIIYLFNIKDIKEFLKQIKKIKKV